MCCVTSVGLVCRILGNIESEQCIHTNGLKLSVTACGKCLEGIHIRALTRANLIVGKNEAVEAPLTTKNVGNKVIMSACPGCTDTVEGCHNCSSGRNGCGLFLITNNLAVLILNSLVIEYLNIVIENGDFKGLEINLTDSLFAYKGSKTALVTMSFLIVNCEMLDKRIHTLGSSTVNLSLTKNARNKSILGIILKVSACEGSTVNIHTGAIPTNGVGIKTVLGNTATHILSKLYIPAASKHVLCGPGHSTKVITDRHRAVSDNIVKTCRAVKVIYLRLVDRINGRRTISALINKLGKLVHLNLIKKLIPERIVIRKSAKVDKINIAILTEYNLQGFLALIGVK